MSFFSSLAATVASNLLTTLTNSYNKNDPLKILEVSASLYTTRPICKRNGSGLVVYGPGAGEGSTYELVFNLPVQVHKDKVYRYYSFVY